MPWTLTSATAYPMPDDPPKMTTLLPRSFPVYLACAILLYANLRLRDLVDGIGNGIKVPNSKVGERLVLGTWKMAKRADWGMLLYASYGKFALELRVCLHDSIRAEVIKGSGIHSARTVAFAFILLHLAGSSRISCEIGFCLSISDSVYLWYVI